MVISCLGYAVVEMLYEMEKGLDMCRSTFCDMNMNHLNFVIKFGHNRLAVYGACIIYTYYSHIYRIPYYEQDGDDDGVGSVGLHRQPRHGVQLHQL